MKKTTIIKVCHHFLPMIFLALVICGCATPHAYRSQDVGTLAESLPAQWAGAPKEGTTPVTDYLLKLIRDERLSHLVNDALKNNPDLRATAFRLKSSGLLLTETAADRWPSVDAAFSKGRDNQSVTEYGKNRTGNRHQVSLNVSWEVDIWGRLADEHAAALAGHRAEASEYSQARDALAARVIQGWVNAAAACQMILCEQERLRALSEVEETIMRRYRSGLGNLEELAAARTRTELAKSDLSAQQERYVRALRTLEVVVGHYPEGAQPVAQELPQIAAPAVGCPASVLERRPDVLAALQRLKAADALASAAAKSLLPSIRLTSQTLRENSSFSKLFSMDTLWNLAGSVSQPVFHRGRLLSRSEARKAETEAAWEDFRAAVLTAMKEVEDGLGADQELERREIHLAGAFQEARQTSRYYEERYRGGLGTIQELLIAREQEMSIRRSLTEIRAERLNNRIDLALALGMGVQEADSETTL